MSGPKRPEPRDRERRLHRPEESHPVRRVLGIGSIIVGMVAAVLFLGSLVTGGGEPPRHPPTFVKDTADGPIAAEAEVFQTHAEDLGMTPMAPRDTAAHARTLVFFRTLREYPGAPPRIPHGLTAEEFENQTCNNCHRRGGFVARFGDYARVTPHPELSQCLQCHVPRDTLVGIPAPTSESASTCAQCHVDPEETLPVFVEHDWQTTSWPDTGQRAHPEAPYLIPHGFQMRTNCLACHAGPEAVTGIRTDHPERINCRQCHVPVHEDAAGPDVAPFRSPSGGGGAGGDG